MRRVPSSFSLDPLAEGVQEMRTPNWSLRSMLLAMFAVCVALSAWRMLETRRQAVQTRVDWLRAIDADVGTEVRGPAWLPYRERYCTDIVSVDLEAVKSSNLPSAVAAIEKCKSLRVLRNECEQPPAVRCHQARQRRSA